MSDSPKVVGMGTIGERLADQPTLDSRIGDAQHWLDILPAPPRPFGDQSDDDVTDWLRKVADIGGIPALNFVYDPATWPFGPIIRGRLQHVVGQMKRRIDDDNKAQREVAAEKQRRELQQRERNLLKEKGWR